MKSIVVEFNGIKFRRYPESPNWADRSYFVPGKGDKMRGIGRLHEEVWRAANGPIPEGCLIHHKDGNPLNNALENLECVTKRKHAQKHKGSYWGNTEAGKKHLASIRPMAALWHSSAEGKRWHKAHGKRVFGHRPPLDFTCKHCGKEFLSTKAGTKYCSNKCKTAARVESGIDNEKRACSQCGRLFLINKYSYRKYCSKNCATLHRAETRKSA